MQVKEVLNDSPRAAAATASTVRIVREVMNTEEGTAKSARPYMILKVPKIGMHCHLRRARPRNDSVCH